MRRSYLEYQEMVPTVYTYTCVTNGACDVQQDSYNCHVSGRCLSQPHLYHTNIIESECIPSFVLDTKPDNLIMNIMKVCGFLPCRPKLLEIVCTQRNLIAHVADNYCNLLPFSPHRRDLGATRCGNCRGDSFSACACLL